MLTTRKGSGIY